MNLFQKPDDRSKFHPMFGARPGSRREAMDRS